RISWPGPASTNGSLCMVEVRMSHHKRLFALPALIVGIALVASLLGVAPVAVAQEPQDGHDGLDVIIEITGEVEVIAMNYIVVEGVRVDPAGAFDPLAL